MKKILKRWKIPYVETGDSHGRHVMLSVVYAIFIVLLIGAYLGMIFGSKAFSPWETITIAIFCGLSSLTYMWAVYAKPEFAVLPIEKTD